MCCICKDALITAISHLASSAEEAIINPKRSESSENRDDGCEADIDDNEDDDDEEEIISEAMFPLLLQMPSCSCSKKFLVGDLSQVQIHRQG